MNNLNSLLEPFIYKTVIVRASGLKLKGKLVAFEHSHHGNLTLSDVVDVSTGRKFVKCLLRVSHIDIMASDRHE